MSISSFLSLLGKAALKQTDHEKNLGYFYKNIFNMFRFFLSFFSGKFETIHKNSFFGNIHACNETFAANF